MAMLKKEMNNHHTEIWESTIAYKDAFRADEPGRRKQRDRDFVARRPGIFHMVTRCQRRQLYLTQSKKGNFVACHHPHAQLQDSKHNYDCQHVRRPQERRPSTTKHESHQFQRSVR
jgi:hypothetical protein